MEIDKSIGRWCVESNELDDVAYQLYMDDVKNLSTIYNEQHNPITQFHFINIYKKWNNFNIFYKQSNQILRRSKIDKIILLLQIKTLSL